MLTQTTELHNTPKSPLMTTAEAAIYIGLAPATLDADRVRGRLKIPFIKLGRSVRYRRADLDAWLDARVYRSTTEADQAAAND